MLKKNNNLALLDIFPKVVPAGQVTEFTVRKLDRRAIICDVKISVASINNSPRETLYKNITPTVEGNLIKFSCFIPEEQEYHVRIINAESEEKLYTLPIYALESDLLERRPLVGDFHAHSNYSDGRESPEFVAAQYRMHGFDFVAVTDHRRYEPSLIARDAYKELDLPFKIYPGEEIHSPGSYVHLVNFASDFSVNKIALKDKSMETWRSSEGEESWLEDVDVIADTLEDVPENVNKKLVASAILAAKYVHEGGGMCIFAHPHWLQNVRNVPDALSEYLLLNGVCDAFELIGGQTAYENQSQIALYNHLVMNKGLRIGIVGSSDEHGTLNVVKGPAHEPCHYFTEERTVVLAKDNTREEIIAAVKGQFSAAVEKYENQYVHIYCNEYRVSQYVNFLMREYFPLRDELYFEEGRLLHEYIAGTEDAAERINFTVKHNAYFEDKYIKRK